MTERSFGAGPAVAPLIADAAPGAGLAIAAVCLVAPGADFR
jgi:hypothetical protein